MTNPLTRLRTAYERDACRYDQRTAAYQQHRQDVVDLLPVQPGDVALDVGCGTGLCLPLLTARVGPTGHVVGIDAAHSMIALAAERVAGEGLRNVSLLASRVEDVDIPVTADAAVFCAVHDILQSPAALDNVFGRLRPGAWVAAGGGKWGPAWNVPLNLQVRALHAPYVSSFDGFAEPWSLLRDYVEDLRVVDVAFGGGYLALGRVPDRPATRGRRPAAVSRSGP